MTDTHNDWQYLLFRRGQWRGSSKTRHPEKRNRCLLMSKLSIFLGGGSIFNIQLFDQLFIFEKGISFDFSGHLFQRSVFSLFGWKFERPLMACNLCISRLLMRDWEQEWGRKRDISKFYQFEPNHKWGRQNRIEACGFEPSSWAPPIFNQILWFWPKFNRIAKQNKKTWRRVKGKSLSLS